MFYFLSSPELMHQIKRTTLSTNIDPLIAYYSIRQRFQNTLILESGGGPQKMASQSIICFDPTHLIEIQGEKMYVDNHKVANGLEDILQKMRNLLNDYEVSPQETFSGGFVGYVSFDFFDLIEGLNSQEADNSFPTAILGFFLDGIVFNHLSGEIYYFHHSMFKSRLSSVLDLLETPFFPPQSSADNINVTYSTSKETFVEMVREAKKRIIQGEIFQVVLSQKGRFRYSKDPGNLYEILRRQNPSPYMYLLQFGSLSIIGTSPELLISESNGKLVTYPIAGTRKVYTDPKRMQEVVEDLLSDPKELAEHDMLVDLARNDLGRVSEIGSVEVKDYKTIQKFSHVIHIVSKVTANLAPNLDMFDAFLSVFPAGTVSGAPKIRAIEIIRELEKEPRGPYAGSVGYFGLGKNMVQAIAIRTAFGNNQDFFIQAGAGIVYDSSPELEYKETLNKLAVYSEILGEIRGGND